MLFRSLPVPLIIGEIIAAEGLWAAPFLLMGDTVVIDHLIEPIGQKAGEDPHVEIRPGSGVEVLPLVRGPAGTIYPSGGDQSRDMPGMPAPGEQAAGQCLEVGGLLKQVVRLFQRLADTRGKVKIIHPVIGLPPFFGRVLFLAVKPLVELVESGSLIIFDKIFEAYGGIGDKTQIGRAHV